MKRISLFILSLCSLLLFFSCTSTKTEKTVEIESFAVYEMGKYTRNELKNMGAYKIERFFMTEKTSGLRIECFDNADYYNGTCLKNTPVSEAKKLLGEKKFAAYWAICNEAGKINERIQKREDNRLIKYIFPNGDYWVADMYGNLTDDMKTTDVHYEMEEIIECQILLPFKYRLNN